MHKITNFPCEVLAIVKDSKEASEKYQFECIGKTKTGNYIGTLKISSLEQYVVLKGDANVLRMEGARRVYAQ
jgi:hypothetical protein